MTGAKEYHVAAGMDDYLAQPIRAAELMEKLKALVRRDATLADRIDAQHVSSI
jgi:DNA-binding response OmpR family regulator